MLNLPPRFELLTVHHRVPSFSFSSRAERLREGWGRSAGSGEWGTFGSGMDWWKTSWPPSCNRDTVRMLWCYRLETWTADLITSHFFYFNKDLLRYLSCSLSFWLIGARLDRYPGSTVTSFCCSPSSDGPVGSAPVSSPSSTLLLKEQGLGQRGCSLSSSLCSVGSTTIEGRRSRL